MKISYLISWHKSEGFDCLLKTQQLAKTKSTCISCELCPMPFV